MSPVIHERLINRYRKKAGIIEVGKPLPLFREVRRRDNIQSNRLTVASPRRVIKARASDAGVEGVISGHSLRVGSAMSLAQAGASVVDMQVADADLSAFSERNRWKSADMPVHYVKAELAEWGRLHDTKRKKAGNI